MGSAMSTLFGLGLDDDFFEDDRKKVEQNRKEYAEILKLPEDKQQGALDIWNPKGLKRLHTVDSAEFWSLDD